MYKLGRNDICFCGSGQKYKNCCLNREPDYEKMDKVVQSLLFNPPEESKSFYPSFLYDTKTVSLPIFRDGYFMVVFLSVEEQQRVTHLVENRLDPFPGIITKRENISSAFRLESVFNAFISGCTVEHMFTFSLGKDVTAVLEKHSQKLNTRELGLYSYNVELAYIISLGNEINLFNLHEYLSDIIIYSIEAWRSNND